MAKWYIVHNPISGIQTANSMRDMIVKRFEKEGLEFKIYQTTGKEDLTALVRAACERGFDHFIVAGGDGTIAPVANALVGTEFPLGIIPLGSGNGLAHDLRIHLQPKVALDLIFGDHTIRKIDLIRVGDQYHLLNISVGVSAKTMEKTGRSQKRKFGILAYFLTLGRVLFGVKPLRLFLEVDGMRLDSKTTEVLLVNSAILRQPVIEWAEDIICDDGELDLFIFPPATSIGFLPILWSFIRGRPKEDPTFNWVPVHKDVLIESRQPVSVQADGDCIGTTPVRAQLVPRILHVIAPPQAEQGHPTAPRKS